MSTVSMCPASSILRFPIPFPYYYHHAALFLNIVGASVVLNPIPKYVTVFVELPDIFNSCSLPGPLNEAFLMESIYIRSKLTCDVGSSILLACPCGIRLHLVSLVFQAKWNTGREIF